MGESDGTPIEFQDGAQCSGVVRGHGMDVVVPIGPTGGCIQDLWGHPLATEQFYGVAGWGMGESPGDGND